MSMQTWRIVTVLLLAIASCHCQRCELAGTSCSMQPVIRQKSRWPVKRDDLLISLHTSHDRCVVHSSAHVPTTPTTRLNLIQASRAWRRGVRTVITSDTTLTPENTPPGLLADVGASKESWRVFHNIKNSNLTLGPRPGDLRYAHTHNVPTYTDVQGGHGPVYRQRHRRRL